MSDGATEPGVTGRRRRHSGEAPPSDNQPEDEGEVGEGEAEAGVTEGVYFAKAPGRGNDVWHAYDAEHEPIGRCYRGTDNRWYVKVGREDAPVNTGSATSAKMWLAGYYHGSMMRHGTAHPARYGEAADVGGAVTTGSANATSTNATGDAHG